VRTNNVRYSDIEDGWMTAHCNDVFKIEFKGCNKEGKTWIFYEKLLERTKERNWVVWLLYIRGLGVIHNITWISSLMVMWKMVILIKWLCVDGSCFDSMIIKRWWIFLTSITRFDKDYFDILVRYKVGLSDIVMRHIQLLLWHFSKTCIRVALIAWHGVYKGCVRQPYMISYGVILLRTEMFWRVK